MSRTARWVLAIGLVIGAAWLALRLERGAEERSAPAPAVSADIPAPAEIAAPPAEIEGERADVPASEAAVPADEPPAPPAEIAAEPNAFTLEVLVHDEAGAPLSGATVATDQYPYVVGTTDESGRCTLLIAPETRVLGLQRVELSLGGYVTSVQSVGLRKAEFVAKGARRSWALARGLPLTCRVVDEQGTPIEGARVRARLPSQFSDGTSLWTDANMDSLERGHNLSGHMPVAALGRTDAQGMTTLVVPKGQFEITAWAPGFLRSPPRLPNSNEPPEPILVDAPQSQAPLEVRLTRGNTVRGHVLTADGTPVAGARAFVDAVGGIVPGASGDDGRLEVTGIPLQSSYRVLVTHPSFAPLNKTRVVAGLFEEFVLDAGRSIRLRVRDAVSAEPVVGPVEVVKVESTDAWRGEHAQAYKDAKAVIDCKDGKLRVDRIGDHARWLRLSIAGYRPHFFELPEGAGPDLGELDVSLEPIRISIVEVVDEQGQPIACAELRIEVRYVKPDGEIWRTTTGQLRSALLAESTFRLPSDRFELRDAVTLSLVDRFATFRQDPFVFKRADEPAPERVVMRCAHH